MFGAIAKMPNCCVPGCNNNLKKLNVTLHNFPRQEKDPQRYEAWKSRINRENFKPNQNHVVCCAHFKTEDFAGRYKKELMPQHKVVSRLFKTAIPSLHLGGKQDAEKAAKRQPSAYMRKKIAWQDKKGQGQPKSHDKICSAHFVGNKKCDELTRFPKNYLRTSTSSADSKKERYKRLLNRSARKQDSGPKLLQNRKQSPQQELTDFCSVQTPAGITQEQFEFLETPITIKEEPLIYLNIEASLPENVCVAEGSTRVKEEPEDIKREKDEDQITQNFESRVEGLDYNASDVEPGFIDVKKERDEDEEPQILESGMEDLDTHNPNATEEPVQIDPATDWRELDVVDLMFLDFARRFKQLSARTQIEVNSRLSQIITEAEVNEIKQRKQNL